MRFGELQITRLGAPHSAARQPAATRMNLLFKFSRHLFSGACYAP